jgi:hypothetical protein
MCDICRAKCRKGPVIISNPPPAQIPEVIDWNCELQSSSQLVEWLELNLQPLVESREISFAHGGNGIENGINANVR